MFYNGTKKSDDVLHSLQKGGTVKKQKRSSKSKKADYEDLALKTAMQYFGDVLLGQLGISEGKIVPIPTESIHLDLRRQEEDFNYLVDGTRIYHFEFQSRNGGRKDLRRFRSYEVALSDTYGMEVITYVIFTGNVRNPITELREGVNTYRIVPITMRTKSADEVFQNIRERKAGGERPKREELVSMMLTPLMSGRMPLAGRFGEAFETLREEERQEENQEEFRKMEAVLYAFASKFLDARELEAVKEVVGMTRLGELLWEEGKAKGKEEGKEEGQERVNRLIELLFEKSRNDEIRRAVTDPEYQKKLFEEFHI